jgi:hypothetical protein
MWHRLITTFTISQTRGVKRHAALGAEVGDPAERIDDPVHINGLGTSGAAKLSCAIKCVTTTPPDLFCWRKAPHAAILALFRPSSTHIAITTKLLELPLATGVLP